jgi:prolipoprotein diacylglyceryltransferase
MFLIVTALPRDLLVCLSARLYSVLLSAFSDSSRFSPYLHSKVPGFRKWGASYNVSIIAFFLALLLLNRKLTLYLFTDLSKNSKLS